MFDPESLSEMAAKGSNPRNISKKEQHPRLGSFVPWLLRGDGTFQSSGPLFQQIARAADQRRMLLVLISWGLLIVGIQLYARYEMITPAEALQALMQLCIVHPAGPLIFVLIAALSPLFLIPAAILGSFAGLCFGPIPGLIYTMIGCNLSALLSYTVGRLSGQGNGRIASLCQRYGPWLQRRPFRAVLLMRLSFLPYDPVNYIVGMLRLRLKPFLIANTLGSLPGVLVIVLFGSTLNQSQTGLLDQPVMIPALLGALLLGVLIALLIRVGLTQRR